MRYDLFLKIDQRRSELSSKLLLLIEVGEEGKQAEARIRSLLRRYFHLLLQVDYFRSESGLDEEMISQLKRRCSDDLQAILKSKPDCSQQLQQLLADQSEAVTFTRDLVSINTPT